MLVLLGFFYGKECFEEIGLFDERLPSYQDYDLWVRISKNFCFDYVNKALYRYYVHEKKIWTNPQALSQGLDMMIKKHCTKDWAVKKHFASQFLLLGVMFCYTGDLEKGRKAYWAAMRLYPFEMRHYFNFFLSFLGTGNFYRLKTLKQRFSR